MRLLPRLIVMSLVGLFCPASPADILFSPEGPVSRVTSAAHLKKYYGDENVKDTKVYVGEGFYEDGTVLFPADPKKKVLITWKDKLKMRPNRVFIRFESTEWKTKFGQIGIGTRLSELETLNGGPFRLAGHSWDYAGTVLNWKGGRLQNELEKPRVRIILRLGGDWSADKNYEIAGDGDYPSSHPVMKKVNPHVYEIVIGFD